MKPFPKTFSISSKFSILNDQTGKKCKRFKFPVGGDKFDQTNAADVENLQQFQIYIGINQIISSIRYYKNRNTFTRNA